MKEAYPLLDYMLKQWNYFSDTSTTAHLPLLHSAGTKFLVWMINRADT